MLIKNIILLSFIITFISGNLLAEDQAPDTLKTVFVPDTIQFVPGGLLDNIIPPTDSINYETKLSQKPMKALFKSMAIPGWGQLGNKRKIKAGIMFALDVWLVSSAIHYGSQASDFRSQYDNTPDSLISLRRDYYSLYTDRRDERNKFTWFAVILSFYSMFDAYVDAHMSGYPKMPEEQSNFSFDIVPNINDGAKALLTYRF